MLRFATAVTYLVEILGFCLMGNHILVRMFPEDKFTDEDILKRYVDFYGDERIFADGLRKKWGQPVLN